MTHCRQIKGRVTGFTLIEMIGALAVIAILASLMVPVVIRQIDRAAWNQEVINLGAVSNAIVLQALRNKTISSGNTWYTDAAGWLNMSPAAVATNGRGFSRAFVVDPAGWLGTVTLPFTQSTNGTIITNSARIMVISTIATGLPISSGSSLSANQFDDIWTTPEGSKPSTWAWNGRGDDLVIQRINLQPLFHRVILYNREGNDVPAYFSVDGAGPAAVSKQWDSYYLDGSVLAISDTNSIVLETDVINTDLSRTYESGAWTESIGVGPPSPAALNYESVAYSFINSSNPPSGIMPIFVAGSLLEFMNTYSGWANRAPCFLQSPPFNKAPEYLILQSVADCFNGKSCAIVP